MLRALCFLSAVGLLSACTQFPELDAGISPDLQDADYPSLIPLEGALTPSQSAQAQQTGAQIAQGVDSRVAALRARAARLRGAVVDPATRARMRRGVQGI